MSRPSTTEQAAATVPPPADVAGFYNRLGLVLPRSRREWVPVRCFLDGHHDRVKSASVNQRTGQWRCFGCNESGGAYAAAVARGYSRSDAAELVQAHGLWQGDWRPAKSRDTAPTSPQTHGEPAATERPRIDWQELSRRRSEPRDTVTARTEYEYLDEHGQPLFRAVRQDFESGNKTFWQERLENGKWKSGLKDVPRVLYRLPEVLEHARRGGLVLVVEGEKNVDALDRLGIFATTSPAGAGKWRDEHARSLQGALVCPVPDCDLAGRRHVVAVCRSLLEQHTRVVGPLELDVTRHDGFDLADHLAAVADTLRAVEPGIPLAEVRSRLRGHVQKMILACLPLTLDRLHAYEERAEHRANPDSRWHDCQRCGRERPHVAKAGVLYCMCGAVTVPAGAA